MRWLLTWGLLLGLPCLGAQATPYQEWLEFKEEFALQAAGPTGMYAIQDMLELNPGEAAYLLPANSIDGIRWSTQSRDDHVARIDFQANEAMVAGAGLQGGDLLQMKDRQLLLPNGLTVRASFLNDKSLKLWLYDPKLVAQRKFKGLAYFPYDPRGVVQGVFRRNEIPVAVSYLDSRDHAGTMYVVGDLQVQIDGKKHDLKAFSYKKAWNEIDGLMLLLRDRTSGKTTYGGGRVVEVPFPKGAPPTTMAVNLNMAYSFLCAHSEFYNCPLILANRVDAELNYGEKYSPP